MIKLPQVLTIQPSSELIFQGQSNELTNATLLLTNPSSRAICFKVKTNATNFYFVYPASGVILPGRCVSIRMGRYPTIEGIRDYDMFQHKFLIQSAYAPTEDFNLKVFWENADRIEVMSSKLCVTFVNSSSAIRSLENPADNRDPLTSEKKTELLKKDKKKIDSGNEQKDQKKVGLEDEGKGWSDRLWNMFFYGRFVEGDNTVVNTYIIFVVLISIGLLAFLIGFVSSKIF